MLDLTGKTVQFLDRNLGFRRYGIVKGEKRVRDEPRMTKGGKRLKRPTVPGLLIKLPNGVELRVREEDVVAVHWYGKDVPVAEFGKEPAKA